AVLLVFYEHSASVEGIQLTPYFYVIGIGKAGVYMFFVLSAYLLTRSLLRTGISWKYYVRRFLRIAPLYYLLLTGVLFYQQIIGGIDYGTVYINYGLRGYIEHLLFVRGDYLLWTIPVEFQFYFLLPLFILLIVRFGRIGVVGLIIFGFLFSCLSYLINSETIEDLTLAIPLVSSMHSYDVFIAGMLTAVLVSSYRKIPDFGSRKQLMDLIFLSVFICAISMTLLGSRQFLVFQEIFPDLKYVTLFYAVSWSLCVYSLAIGNPFLEKLLSFQWLQTIGKCCFSWYLLHLVVFRICAPLLNSIAPNMNFMNLVIITLITYYVCKFTFHYIERPFMKMVR
ncbi:MAG: acyltransferase, partial [Ekhidna sp.]